MLTRQHRNLLIAATQTAVADMAHGLNQPAAAFSLLLETAGMKAQRTGSSSEVTSALQDAEAQMDRLVGLLRTVSQNAREATLAPPPNGSTIRSLVAAAVEASGIEQLEAGHLIVDVPDIHFAGAAEFEVIALALLQNCVEAPATGEVRVTATLTGTARCDLVVSNSGPTPTSLDMLCEPFFTTKVHHLGLGLSLCRRLAALHGGDLQLEELPGGGLVVHVELRASDD